ncbi:unnamed protein product [Malus baccata var. baccata]
MDVKNAFLHGDLEEEVYMKLSLGHPRSSDPDMVCKLHKSIYGLKQSPHAWYTKLRFVLEEFGFHISKADCSLFVHIGLFLQGFLSKSIKLIYLTITRPDISYAVSIGSVGRGILMQNNGNTQVMGYTDADWAGNSFDCKSTIGFCTFVGGNLVTWKSKKQSVVARSSVEAKYRAMASTRILSKLGSLNPFDPA